MRMSLRERRRCKAASCHRQNKIKRSVHTVLKIGLCVGSIAAAPQVQAQSFNSQFYQINHDEVAEQQLLDRPVATTSLPTQAYMREVFWGSSETTPAFFRDSLVQVVARTYDLTRDNFDGTRTQGWAAGGWLAYRSGLIADTFGVHAAFYTSRL